MKLVILAIVLLAGCAPLTAQNSTGTITTGSRFYNAEFAAKAGLNQAQTAECERQGRAVWAAGPGKNGDSSPLGGIDGVAAGRAYEKCVLASKK